MFDCYLFYYLFNDYLMIIINVVGNFKKSLYLMIIYKLKY